MTTPNPENSRPTGRLSRVELEAFIEKVRRGEVNVGAEYIGPPKTHFPCRGERTYRDAGFLRCWTCGAFLDERSS